MPVLPGCWDTVGLHSGVPTRTDTWHEASQGTAGGQTGVLVPSRGDDIGTR